LIILESKYISRGGRGPQKEFYDCVIIIVTGGIRPLFQFPRPLWERARERVIILGPLSPSQAVGRSRRSRRHDGREIERE